MKDAWGKVVRIYEKMKNPFSNVIIVKHLTFRTFENVVQIIEPS